MSSELKQTHYLNVDLDIYSKSDLRPLVVTLGKKVSVLFVGREKRSYSTHLELMGHRNADSTIRGLCALIQSLPPAERKLWSQAKVREFNIGVQGAARPTSYEITLKEETVKATAELGARIGVTIYGRLKKAPRSLQST